MEKGGVVMKQKGTLVVFFVLISCCQSIDSRHYHVVCLKGATEGQDQALRKSYDTAYSTYSTKEKSRYRCYFKFDNKKIDRAAPVQALFFGITERYALPSHGGKQVYFKDDTYKIVIENLRESGKSLEQLKKNLGIPDEAIKKSWENAKKELDNWDPSNNNN